MWRTDSINAHMVFSSRKVTRNRSFRGIRGSANPAAEDGDSTWAFRFSLEGRVYEVNVPFSAYTSLSGSQFPSRQTQGPTCIFRSFLNNTPSFKRITA